MMFSNLDTAAHIATLAAHIAAVAALARLRLAFEQRFIDLTKSPTQRKADDSRCTEPAGILFRDRGSGIGIMFTGPKNITD